MEMSCRVCVCACVDVDVDVDVDACLVESRKEKKRKARKKSLFQPGAIGGKKALGNRLEGVVD